MPKNKMWFSSFPFLFLAYDFMDVLVLFCFLAQHYPLKLCNHACVNKNPKLNFIYIVSIYI